MTGMAAALYTLTFDGGPAAGEQTVSFHAESTSTALEMATREAKGDWAKLSLDGRLLCKMKLVSETGVWLLETSNQSEGVQARSG